MQFLPTTWRTWATLAPGRPAGSTPDPNNAWDAIYAAGLKLCNGREAIADLQASILGYNPSATYLQDVWEKATAYGMTVVGSTPTSPGSGGAATVSVPGPGRTVPGDPAAVVAFALTQLGVPYVFGAATAGVALDCSGLVEVSYRAAGVELPRTTFEQVAWGSTVGDNQLAPGDLLFFTGGAPLADFGHVAIYVGDSLMIEAPDSGATVRLSPVPLSAIEVARRILVASG
jgi:cell wall-associated NlpC family hydrolase